MAKILFTLSPDRKLDLARLQSEAGCSSRTDLINNALTFFVNAVKVSRKGEMIASIDPASRIYTTVDMQSLRTARQRA